MQKYLLAMIVGLGLAASAVYFTAPKSVAAHAVASINADQTQPSGALFNPDGTVNLPTGFRKWVFVGAPLTPEGLNNGKYNCDAEGKNCTKSNFPEYHHVYIEQKNVDVFMKTGDFPEGTVIVKELTRVLNPEFPDSSRKEPSGRGYFNGAYNGVDMSIKDSKRFAKTNGWGFFTFGHHPMPYEKTSAERPAAECAGCHIANVADTDMTYIKFYPLLRDKVPY